MLNQLKLLWTRIRRLSGDDAYEQYLQHFAQHQLEHVAMPSAELPLSRADFFKEWQDKKWKGIKRCC